MAGRGINVKIEAPDMMAFTNKLDKMSKATNPAIAVGLNEIGDGLLAVLSNNLAKETGLAVEQVRGLINIKRAKSNSLRYEVTIKKGLLEGDAGKLEGKRESDDFGKRQPRALVVIVSKNDENVCPDCEELQAAGAMPIEIAKQHIPKHPHCRCVIMPYVQKGKRLPVTMTTVSGTDPRKRMGGKGPINVDMTIRQLAQKVLDQSANKIRIELRK
jgi:hypothetical protein